MAQEARRKPQVEIPVEVTAVIDRVQEVSSGNINVFQPDPTKLSGIPACFDTFDGALRPPYLYLGRPRVMIDFDNVGLAKDSTLASVLPRTIVSGRVEVVSMPPISVASVVITGRAGVFSQWNNVSVASGSTNTYGPFDISSVETKTIGVWVNTGNVGVSILVSNDNTVFKPYYSFEVTSGMSSTKSFTERFASMRIDVLGATEAGYTLMVSRGV